MNTNRIWLNRMVVVGLGCLLAMGLGGCDKPESKSDGSSEVPSCCPATQPLPEVTVPPLPAAVETPPAPTPAAAPAPAAVKPPTVKEFLALAAEGNTAKVREAIAAGMDPNTAAPTGLSALMLASFEGKIDTVKVLVDAGAKVNAHNELKRTALMMASSGPFVETVRYLLKKGADVNAVDSHESWSALMLAASEGQPEVCEVLLKAGANPTLVDDDGDTAASFAKKKGHSALVKTLEAAAADYKAKHPEPAKPETTE